MNKRKSSTKRSSCGLCGVGTYLNSEICVRCAEKLLEQSEGVTQAKGVIPAPSVDDVVVAEYLQSSFWTAWEK